MQLVVTVGPNVEQTSLTLTVECRPWQVRYPQELEVGLSHSTRRGMPLLLLGRRETGALSGMRWTLIAGQMRCLQPGRGSGQPLHATHLGSIMLQRLERVNSKAGP